MIYEKFGEFPTFIAIKNWIRPIVAGLMIVFAALFALESILMKKGTSKVVVTGLLAVLAVIACNILC